MQQQQVTVRFLRSIAGGPMPEYGLGGFGFDADDTAGLPVELARKWEGSGVCAILPSVVTPESSKAIAGISLGSDAQYAETAQTLATARARHAEVQHRIGALEGELAARRSPEVGAQSWLEGTPSKGDRALVEEVEAAREELRVADKGVLLAESRLETARRVASFRIVERLKPELHAYLRRRAAALLALAEIEAEGQQIRHGLERADVSWAGAVPDSGFGRIQGISGFLADLQAFR